MSFQGFCRMYVRIHLSSYPSLIFELSVRHAEVVGNGDRSGVMQ
jgi:hypothetical protein